MGKTRYSVVDCFDGDSEAIEAFTDVITRKITRKKTIISFSENENDTVENEMESGYNETQVHYLNHASGLCG